jgi:hypothetical protein
MKWEGTASGCVLRWGRGVMILTAVLVMGAGQATGVWAAAGYEKQPVLTASELAPAELLKGARFRVEDKVPTEGFLGQFTIRSDVGTFEAHGLDMLKVRIAELAALEQLETASKTETFLKAMGSTAERPVKAVTSLVTRPVETVKGVPSGIERFFGRVKRGGESAIATVTTPGVSSTDKAEALSRRIGGITVDALGYEQERRQLAKHLQVDPYTTNPVLAQKLDEFAWVAFSGRVGVNAIISVVVPASMAVSATTFTTDMVWDTPAAELLRVNDQKLREMGLSESAVRAMIGNPWHSLSQLTAFVTALERLQGASGRDTVATLAASAVSEDQARFVTAATQMLASYHQTVAPLSAVMGRGTVTGRNQRGAVVVPAPLDYVAWTARVAEFAKRSDLKARERHVWLTGQMSPRARDEMTKLGWGLHDGGRLRPSQPSVR